MTKRDFVIQHEPDARCIVRNYGNGHALVYSIELNAFAPPIGRGKTEREAWENAALDVEFYEKEKEVS